MELIFPVVADHTRQVFSLEWLDRKSFQQQRALFLIYSLTLATYWLKKLSAKGSPSHKKNSRRRRRKIVCYSQGKIALENFCASSVTDVIQLLDFMVGARFLR